MAVKNVIVIRETVMESWISDASTYALFMALIGPGVYLGSSAMQWAGLIIALVTCLAKANARRKDMTKEEAIKFIHEMED